MKISHSFSVNCSVSCLCFHFACNIFIPCIWFSFLCSKIYQYLLLLHLDFESYLGRPSCGFIFNILRAALLYLLRVDFIFANRLKISGIKSGEQEGNNKLSNDYFY